MHEIKYLVTLIVLVLATSCSTQSAVDQQAESAHQQTSQDQQHAVNPYPRAIDTVILGPFTGFDAPLHPDNTSTGPLEYYGTDLGWSYEHDGKIHFIFGDTHKNEMGELLNPTHDDAYGWIELSEWPDASAISEKSIPLIKLGQIEGTTGLNAIDTGQPMEALKTPNGAFSNGTREFGTFITGKPRACVSDAQCPSGFECDTELGYIGASPELDPGLTLPCADSWPGCNSAMLADEPGRDITNSGICVDPGSSIATKSDAGRVASASMELLVGIRSLENPAVYGSIHSWNTNRFINLASRTVSDFVPERGAGRKQQDYRNIRGTDNNQRVFLWGRPWFNGVKAKGQINGLYFAYADMPLGDNFDWTVHYYTGSDTNGVPIFSPREVDATPVDLDAAVPGIQPLEVHDWVQHMSVVWVEELGKWIMIYGGGISMVPREYPGTQRCGVAEIFVRTECDTVELGNGALRMRTADDPWGPWTSPQDLIVAGDPRTLPLQHQYAPGGVLYHPDCSEPSCQQKSAQALSDDYGWFYGANIIEEWNTPTPDGVDVYWLASTWVPYRVIMLRTQITR